MTSAALSISDRVISISNDLYRQGIKPSVRLVLAQMPDIKSTSAIHKPYAEWKRELDANQQSLHDRLYSSPEFTESLMKELTRFSVEAENRYKSLAMDAEEQRDIAIEDLERADNQLTKQAAAIAQLESELKALKSDMAESAKANETNLIDLHKQINEQFKSLLSASDAALKTAVAKTQLQNDEKYAKEVQQLQNLIEQNRALNSTIAESNKNSTKQKAVKPGKSSFRQEFKEPKENETILKAVLNTPADNSKTDVFSSSSDDCATITEAEVTSQPAAFAEAYAKIETEIETDEIFQKNDAIQSTPSDQASAIKRRRRLRAR